MEWWCVYISWQLHVQPHVPFASMLTIQPRIAICSQREDLTPDRPVKELQCHSPHWPKQDWLFCEPCSDCCAHPRCCHCDTIYYYPLTCNSYCSCSKDFWDFFLYLVQRYTPSSKPSLLHFVLASRRRQKGGKGHWGGSLPQVPLISTPTGRLLLSHPGSFAFSHTWSLAQQTSNTGQAHSCFPTHQSVTDCVVSKRPLTQVCNG